jgi:16S rRNA (guanine527-N7)-methyltransferase
MPTLPITRIATLLAPYLSDAPVPPSLYEQLSVYLELLLKWNARTNLTAIRDPEQIITRHFGESLFTGLQLTTPYSLLSTHSLLDFGSGAGFPGLPIQLLLPDLSVTLAESQGKKSSFLREAVRTLGLKTEVWAGRVEDMPAEKTFDVVTLRAVDNMSAALAAARSRVASGGLLVTLSAEQNPVAENIPMPGAIPSWVTLERC